MDQRRRRTRVESRKPATLTGAGGETQGEISNVSLKGCLVELAEGPLPRPGEPISVTIHLEASSPELDVTLKARVVRLYPGKVAVEFTEVSPESFHHLFRFVQYNAPDPEGIEKELGTSAFEPTED